MLSARLTEQLIGVLAALCCLIFTLGLSDTPVQPLQSTPPVQLPQSAVRDAELSAKATDPEGRALEGVMFTAFWKRGSEYFWAGRRKTGLDGVAHFQRLPRGVVWLVAEAKGRARASTQLVLAEEPRHAGVRLGPMHELRVWVKDEANQPIPDATVVTEADDPLPHGALTDPQGLALFDRLGPPPYRVRVSAQGYETRRLDVEAEVSVVLRRLSSLTVHVVDEQGNSVPEATVLIAGARLWPSRKTLTDSKGRVSISGLLAGAYDMRAMRGSNVSETLLGFNLQEGKSDEVTLRLAAGRMVRASVMDREGSDARPVADADVVLVEGGLGSFPLRGRTNGSGVVALGPIAVGPAALSARAPGFVGRSSVPVPDVPDPEVRVALVRGATLTGRVVDAQGYPIGGASIEVVGSDLFGLPVADSPLLMNFSRAHFAWALSGPVQLVPAGELGVMPGPVPPIPGLGVTLSNGAAESAQEAVDPWVTRATGEFAAHPVTPGRVRALVRHPDFVEALSEVVSLTPGGTASVRVELFRGGTLEGRIVDEHGFPVRFATVQLSALSGTYESVAVTADDGSFAFAAVPKQVALSVARSEDPGRSVLREHLEVTEGERTEIELSLPAPRGSVEVRIVSEDDQPLSMAQVSAASLEASAPRRETLFTDDSGRVSFTDLQGLPVQFSIQALGFAPLQQQLAAAPEQLSIALKLGVLVEGSVTAIRGRFPAVGARVTLLVAGERRQTLTDGRGQYRFENVPQGEAELNVEHSEHAPATLNVQIKDTGRPDRPLELASIDLVEPGSVSGRVVDREGQPVAGARVALGFVPAFVPVGALPDGVVTSDGNGEFSLAGLAPGEVEVAGYLLGMGRGSTKAEVVGGRSTDDIEIVLSEPVEQDTNDGRGNVAITLGERGDDGGVDVVVVSVAEASEAERGGLRVGDGVLSVAGELIRDLLQARKLLAGQVGSEVLVEVERGRETKLLSVVREQLRR